MSTKMSFERKNIIVTGGAGFLGSHLCKALAKDKNFVICIDDLSSGSERNIDQLLSLPNFEFIKHNLNEKINLEEKKELAGKIDLEFQGIQEIYHLAALTSPKKFDSSKLEVLKTNLDATRVALDLAASLKAKFLLASSSVIYGKRPNDRTFFQEDYFGYVDPIGPRCSYDEGKRCSETLAATYKEMFNLEVKIARIFRSYGPGMKLREGHMLPDFALAALNGNELIVHGDSSFSTSLCYVSDIIDGVMKLMAQDNDIGPINLGSDQLYKINDVAQKIIEIAKEFSPLAKNSKITYGESLLFTSPLGLPSIVRAKEKLGWLPIMTLEKGLRNMVEYIMASKDLLEIREE